MKHIWGSVWKKMWNVKLRSEVRCDTIFKIWEESITPKMVGGSQVLCDETVHMQCFAHLFKLYLFVRNFSAISTFIELFCQMHPAFGSNTACWQSCWLSIWNVLQVHQLVVKSLNHQAFNLIAVPVILWLILTVMLKHMYIFCLFHLYQHNYVAECVHCTSMASGANKEM